MGRARRASVGARPGAPARVSRERERAERRELRAQLYNFYFKCSNNKMPFSVVITNAVGRKK